ncbi:MAG: helicase-related protein [Gammaproteobacteria bacterium]|nr:helicase-related protein [Gammaproteobacteria bacterium]
MTVESKGRGLFIVDNSVSGWTGLRYLEDWSVIASAFDIATGYFEIGALLALDGKWQQLEKIRILMGAETTHRTRKAILEAVRTQALLRLDESMEDDKEPNPFMHGVPAILDALRSGQVECRIYSKDKFHAKAYITHAKLEVVGAQALVGSSNFTQPGLTRNIELNVQVQSAREVAQLQEWFETHWDEANDVTGLVVETISRHTQLYTPFDIYAKALEQFFRGHELTATEWDETKSGMFQHLDGYQKEAYWALMKIARQHGGAFLCDGVGLGKTFVGLMLIERLIIRERKRVVLFAPKAAKEGVWEPHLRRWLPHIGGVSGGGDFSNLAVFSHTDLGRKGDFPARFERIAGLADVVVIDEAHYFRNPGRRGDATKGNEPSRYYRLFDLLNDSAGSKTVFMLTATPINNRLSDFRHMTELFTRRDEAYFAQTIGVNNLRAHFNQMEQTLRVRVGRDAADVAEHMTEVQEILSTDDIFRQLVVQRSRAYARESQMREHGKATAFPDRMDPQVAAYSIRKTYGRMLNLVEEAFRKERPLFTLPMYYPLHWYRGSDKEIDAFEENRQRQVVGLIRTNFLKRFESSIAAFELSCDRLLKKLLAFLEVHSSRDTERKRLDRWKAQHKETLGHAAQRQLDFWGEEDDEAVDEDVVPQEMIDAVDPLDRAEYDVEAMMVETFRDLNQIVRFLEEARKFEPKHDDKLQRLVRLLESKRLVSQKVLIFTEFADTARYVKRHLDEAGIEGVEQVDSATKRNRIEVIQQFSPYYNGLSSPALADHGHDEIRVLISTDVLSEGLNLQDASRMINYDIHWNPVRLMQRIGRVDRRMDPEIEKQLVMDHPEVAASRGKVWFWNFLPPEELNEILSLYAKVTQKALLISETLGIEGKKLLRPDDDYEPLKEFNQTYEGTRTTLEDMHLEYQELLQADPELEDRLARFPAAVFSGRKRPAKGVCGVFFCYSLPALDKEKNDFTEEAGTTRWYLYDVDLGTILEEPSEIVMNIRTDSKTSRRCTMKETTLMDIRKRIEKHIKNGYLKRVAAPVGVKPRLRCWMELNEG